MLKITIQNLTIFYQLYLLKNNNFLSFDKSLKEYLNYIYNYLNQIHNKNYNIFEQYHFVIIVIIRFPITRYFNFIKLFDFIKYLKIKNYLHYYLKYLKN